MRIKILIIFLLLNTGVFSQTPPQEIPAELYSQYTLNGQIPVLHRYFDNTYPVWDPIFFTRGTLEYYKELVMQRKRNYYGKTDDWLYQALKDYPIQGKKIAIIGSRKPWYESIVLVYGGSPVTIDYNRIECIPRELTAMTVKEYDENPILFDAIFSISSIEHDGLGRYGDPLDPNGDLKSMKKLKKMLKKGGLCYLAVPIGADCLVWNAHRIYGKKRLPKLLKEWQVLKTYGFSKRLVYLPLKENAIQPVFVLQPKEHIYAEDYEK